MGQESSEVGPNMMIGGFVSRTKMEKVVGLNRKILFSGQFSEEKIFKRL